VKKQKQADSDSCKDSLDHSQERDRCWRELWKLKGFKTHLLFLGIYSVRF
jgi:hypothetical protein